jgi:hypothetical protein
VLVPPTAEGTPEGGAAPEPVPEPAAPPPAAPVAQVLTPVAVPAHEPALLPLERRVRRLEDAIAQLQDLQGIQTRVAGRVPGPAPQAQPATPSRPSAELLLNVGKHLLGAAASAAPATPPAPQPQPPTPPLSGRARGVWLFRDTVAEARAILHMFVDPRYRMSWAGRIVVVGLAAAFVFSYWWVPGTSIPLVGYWVNKAVDLVLAFVLFKVLGYEARRYRETAPDLPPTLRL